MSCHRNSIQRVKISVPTVPRGCSSETGGQKQSMRQLRRRQGNWTTRGYANSRIANSWTGHLADWSTRGLQKSRTGQLAVSQMPPKERKLSTQSRRWHPRVVQSATCPVRELSSPRVDQTARCLVRESASPRVGNPRVGVSASCPVTGASRSITFWGSTEIARPEEPNSEARRAVSYTHLTLPTNREV